MWWALRRQPEAARYVLAPARNLLVAQGAQPIEAALEIHHSRSRSDASAPLQNTRVLGDYCHRCGMAGHAPHQCSNAPKVVTANLPPVSAPSNCGC
eukprot:7360321-Prymnesium_polylepis.1